VAVTRHDGLANRWFQPLTHVSGLGGEGTAYSGGVRTVQPASTFMRSGAKSTRVTARFIAPTGERALIIDEMSGSKDEM
jgi:hypothetical protein